MITKEQIISLAGEALKDTDRYVVNVTVSSDNVIEVFIDSDTSVTIDDCVEASRYIEDHLDRDAEDFELSVSSAGIDEPLLVARQYRKYIGQNLFITKNDGVKKMYRLVSFNELQLEVQEAEAKLYGKLTKVVYHDNETIKTADIKEIRPYIKF
ncbi:MAG: ribosome assembly cofactor RimP [Bacteroidales bacterium]|nr:ribosome assembly cofactor RimP [Bacteroidales bacterium]